MYRKGMSFIGAALLLRRHRGDEYVVLHLLCQGTELLLKGLLLIKDYDLFKGKLRRPIGHDLMKASDEVSRAFGTPKIKGPTGEQLKELSTLYKAAPGEMERTARPTAWRRMAPGDAARAAARPSESAKAPGKPQKYHVICGQTRSP